MVVQISKIERYEPICRIFRNKLFNYSTGFSNNFAFDEINDLTTYFSIFFGNFIILVFQKASAIYFKQLKVVGGTLKTFSYTKLPYV